MERYEDLGWNGEGVTAVGNLGAVDGADNTSDRMPETWSMPPWMDGAAVDRATKSEIVENPTKTMENPTLSAELGRHGREAKPDSGKSNVVRDGWPGEQSALTFTRAANGDDPNSDAETRYRQSIH